MELVTLKQFAEQKGISYEAVRRQVKRYAAELGHHVVTKDGVRYLDSEAVDLLSDRRRLSPIVTMVEDQSEVITDLQNKIEGLKKQIEDLKARLLATQEQLNKSREQIVVEQSARILDQQKIIQMQEDARIQIESHAESDAARRLAEERLEEQTKEVERLRAEVDSFERTLFGFYRKRG